MSEQENNTNTLGRILDSAERLFAERGFHGTSTRQIAAEAGVSIQTCYYHCDNKLNLYHMVLERSVLSVTSMVDSHVERMLDHDLNDERLLKEDTDRFIDELFDVVSDRPNHARLLLRQWLEQDTELHKVEQEGLMPDIREWVGRVEATVNEERRRGIDLPVMFLSLSWIYWGLNVSPKPIGSLLGLDPKSLEYRQRLKEYAKNMTDRMIGTRLPGNHGKRGE